MASPGIEPGVGLLPCHHPALQAPTVEAIIKKACQLRAGLTYYDLSLSYVRPLSNRLMLYICYSIKITSLMVISAQASLLYRGLIETLG